MKLEPDKFRIEEDSTIYIRNKTKDTKLGLQFQRKTGTITDESKHAIAIKDIKRKSQEVANRDIAKTPDRKLLNSRHYSPQRNSLERKLATLQDAEQCCNLELSNP